MDVNKSLEKSFNVNIIIKYQYIYIINNWIPPIPVL